MVTSFNSKLVRLKDQLRTPDLHERRQFQFQIGAIKSAETKSYQQRRFEFQFQIGAIKSQNNDVTARATREFQFQIGAIKSYGIVREDRQHSRFNSKLVRLKVRTVISCLLLLTIRFNSKLVRLKAYVYSPSHKKERKVSIPNWCD